MLLLLLSGCDQPSASRETPVTGRWYTQQQLARGEPLYQSYCARCHKVDASGTQDWRSPNAQGQYPPPPLDGTAHTWHHPLAILQRTVAKGGASLGGSMPGFAEQLSPQQIDDILAWLQSRWSDKIYRLWQERNQQTSKRW